MNTTKDNIYDRASSPMSSSFSGSDSPPPTENAPFFPSPPPAEAKTRQPARNGKLPGFSCTCPCLNPRTFYLLVVAFLVWCIFLFVLNFHFSQSLARAGGRPGPGNLGELKKWKKAENMKTEMERAVDSISSSSVGRSARDRRRLSPAAAVPLGPSLPSAHQAECAAHHAHINISSLEENFAFLPAFLRARADRLNLFQNFTVSPQGPQRTSAPQPASPSPDHRFHLLIALNLYENASILKDLLTELLRLIDYFHSYSDEFSLSLSIYESSSQDQTENYLQLFQSFLRKFQIQYRIVTSGAFQRGNQHFQGPYGRIIHLSHLRNAVLAPLWENPPEDPQDPIIAFDRIVFLNDIYFCAEDVLQLLGNSIISNSLVHSGLDFDNLEGDDKMEFYDTWVSVDRHGDRLSKPFPFFPSEGDQKILHGPTARSDIPEGKILSPAESVAAFYDTNIPVSCAWNGLAVLHPDPIARYGVRFRAGLFEARAAKSETPEEPEMAAILTKCAASECTQYCRDLWRLYGFHSRLFIEPSALVSYDLNNYRKLQKQSWFTKLQKSAEANYKWMKHVFENELALELAADAPPRFPPPSEPFNRFAVSFASAFEEIPGGGVSIQGNSIDYSCCDTTVVLQGVCVSDRVSFIDSSSDQAGSESSDLKKRRLMQKFLSEPHEWRDEESKP